MFGMQTMTKGKTIRNLVSAVVLCAPAPVLASNFEFVVFNMPMAEALDTIGSEIDIEFSGHRSSRQRLENLYLTGTRDDIVSQLSQSMNLDAFQFNGQVHLSPIQDRTVRLIRLGDVSSTAALSALDEAGLVVPEFDISEVADGNALVISGPVKYLAISESIIATLQPEEIFVEPQVRVRRGGKLEAESAEVSAVENDSNQ